MYAKILSVSDELMWTYYTLLSFRSEADIAALRAEVAGGRNPKDAKVQLAREITARFHGAPAAESAQQDFENRARGGVPDDIPTVTLTGAPLGIGALLRQAQLAPSSSEANRLIEQGGVRVDGDLVADKGLKLAAGSYVVQVGKRKFARVELA
jgi:tyrosyl-tRNA synthetase